MPEDRIYLDHNASCPLAPEVSSAISPLLGEGFGNPSSLHWAGRKGRDAVERSRGQVSDLLGCATDEVVFTSGGSESNNLALKGSYFAARGSRFHMVTAATEHPAVLAPALFLEGLGAEVTVLDVDRHGLVSAEAVACALEPHTRLVSVMHANNETGTVNPIARIGRLCRERGVLFHTDAAQTAGKLPVGVADLCVDLLTLAAHKFYGPKGVGALYVRRGVRLEPLVHGAGHERGLRAGTENVLLVAGLGAAASLARDLSWTERARRLRDRLHQGIVSLFGNEAVTLVGHPEERLPNTVNLCFHGRHGSEILASVPAVAASTGSACHAGEARLSPVLHAMGVPREVGMGAVRFSLGRGTTEAEVDRVLSLLTPLARS